MTHDGCDLRRSHDHCVHCEVVDPMPWTHEDWCPNYQRAESLDTPEARAAVAAQNRPLPVSITGTVRYVMSTSGHPCICCPDGHHIVGYRFEADDPVPGLDTVGKTKVASVDWNFWRMRSVPDGTRVRFTFEVIE